jgi:hypothetical protein
MKTYIYYVAYNHPRGFGACQVFWAAPIEDLTQIHAIADQILTATPQLGQVVVMSFQLLRTEES